MKMLLRFIILVILSSCQDESPNPSESNNLTSNNGTSNQIETSNNGVSNATETGASIALDDFELADSIPSDGSSNVPTNSEVILKFSEEIQAESIRKKISFFVDDISVSYQIQHQGNNITLTPDTLIPLDSRCIISIEEGITDRHGRTLGETELSFHVRRGEWNESPDPLHESNSQASLVFSGSNIFITWNGYYPGPEDIWAMVVNENGVVEPLQKIEGAPTDAENEKIVSDGKGNAMIVWSQNDGAYESLWSNTYRKDLGWTGPTLVETHGEDVHLHQVAMAPNGNAIATWIRRRFVLNSSTELWVNHYSPESGWGEAQKLEEEEGQIAFPEIDIDAQGNAIVIWTLGGYGYEIIWSNLFTKETGWQSRYRIDAERPRSQFQKIKLVDGVGVAMWLKYEGSQYSVWTNTFTIENGWGAAEHRWGGTNLLKELQLSMSKNGDVLAVWELEGSGIFSLDYTAQGGWGLLKAVSRSSRLPENPSLAIDDFGNGTVAWMEYPMGENYSNVHVSSFSTTNRKWSTPKILTSGPNTFLPVIAVGEKGVKAMIWNQNGVRFATYR